MVLFLTLCFTPIFGSRRRTFTQLGCVRFGVLILRVTQSHHTRIQKGPPDKTSKWKFDIYKAPYKLPHHGKLLRTRISGVWTFPCRPYLITLSYIQQSSRARVTQGTSPKTVKNFLFNLLRHNDQYTFLSSFNFRVKRFGEAEKEKKNEPRCFLAHKTKKKKEIVRQFQTNEDKTAGVVTVYRRCCQRRQPREPKTKSILFCSLPAFVCMTPSLCKRFLSVGLVFAEHSFIKEFLCRCYHSTNFYFRLESVSWSSCCVCPTDFFALLFFVGFRGADLERTASSVRQGPPPITCLRRAPSEVQEDGTRRVRSSCSTLWNSRLRRAIERRHAYSSERASRKRNKKQTVCTFTNHFGVFSFISVLPFFILLGPNKGEPDEGGIHRASGA